ncbi:MAG: carbohydrate kinase family protein [Chloroflexales bacterium]|nr:carbohydrate kinase family protein [Chloroflexales bacterium]
MRVVVTGSLAYDYIMNFPGLFKDHILPDRVHMLSVSFLVDSMKRMRGGVAGNIAYTMALLGLQPLVVAAAGQDFGEYRQWMNSQGVDASGIHEVIGEFTASCFINTDQANNQLVAFYTGAMARSRDLSLLGFGLTKNDLVVISPTDPEAMARYVHECREMGVPFLFDPGKQTPRLTAEQILDGLNGAFALIGNDYEFAMMSQVTGKSERELIESVPLTVITQGEKGSIISESHNGLRIDTSVDVAPVDEVRDPTGAGDAYLAGFVFGLSQQLPAVKCGQIASLAGAYAIERHGCQEHTYVPAEFYARYVVAFGADAQVATAFGVA